MIALNETNEYAAEVAFTLPLDSDPLTGLTGWTFTLGEVQILLPGGSWTNVALNKIVEKGYGRFAARLTSAQTGTAGDVYIKAVVDGTQYYFGSDTISTLGGDIPLNATDGSIPFFIPDGIDPVVGTPLDSSHVWVTGEVRVCLPDGSYVDADPNQVEALGFGGFRLNLTAAQTTKAGKVFVYVSVPGYQRFEGYNTILGLGPATEPVVVTPTPIPVPVSITSPTSTYMDLISHAVNRLCEYSKSGEFEPDQSDLGVV